MRAGLPVVMKEIAQPCTSTSSPRAGTRGEKLRRRAELQPRVIQPLANAFKERAAQSRCCAGNLSRARGDSSELGHAGDDGAHRARGVVFEDIADFQQPRIDDESLDTTRTDVMC